MAYAYIYFISRAMQPARYALQASKVQHTAHGDNEMDFYSMTLGDIKRIAAAFGEEKTESPFIGKYVIVRCRDAGVHAGVLVSASGRNCVLKDARRLWYWKPANGAAFLSGVASEGLDSESKIGCPVGIELTENCEIIMCSSSAQKSIMEAKSHEA